MGADGRILCLAILIQVLGSGLAAAQALQGGSSFNYDGWPPARHFGFEIRPGESDDGWIVDGWDSFEEAMFCSPEEPFTCIDSRIVSLLIPKRSPIAKGQWAHAGITGASTSEARLKLLGLECPLVHVVSAVSQRAPAAEWLFSESLGAVAVRFDGSRRVYWLSELNGFGSREGSNSCVRVKSVEPSQEFRYVAWVAGGDDLTINTRGSGTKVYLVRNGSDQVEGSLCAQSDSMTCIVSPALTFAVPKSGLSSSDKWRMADTRFEVTRRNFSMRILGRLIDDLVAIRGVNESHRETQYIYSPRHGLLGIGVFGETSKSDWAYTYWSESENGFGAVPSPSGHP